MRVLILAALAVILASPADARCFMSYCRDQATVSTPAPSTSWAITNTSRQKVGTIYHPGHNRRVQIRDTSRRIIGYIERDGTVTTRHRQRIGVVEEAQ